MGFEDQGCVDTLHSFVMYLCWAAGEATGVTEAMEAMEVMEDMEATEATEDMGRSPCDTSLLPVVEIKQTHAAQISQISEQNKFV